MSKMKLDWDKWLYGLGSAIISGGSAAVTGGIVSALAFKVDVTTMAGAFKIVGVMFAQFLVAGAFGMFFFFKQSPLPPVETETTETVRQSSDARGNTMSEASKTVTTTPVAQTTESKTP